VQRHARFTEHREAIEVSCDLEDAPRWLDPRMMGP
jgi:hypothetical protein